MNSTVEVQRGYYGEKLILSLLQNPFSDEPIRRLEMIIIVRGRTAYTVRVQVRSVAWGIDVVRVWKGMVA